MSMEGTTLETTVELAKRVFSELQVTLLSYEGGAVAGDVESVHDMRVTTRKLRVALANFAVCVPLETRRRIKNHLNQVADALGRVRDIDVMLESLASIEAAEPPTRKPFIIDLRSRLIRRRKYHHQRLIQYLRSDGFRDLKTVLPELTGGQTVQDQKDNTE